MDAGYSGTPLPKKLNLPPAGRWLMIGVPEHVADLLVSAEATVDSALEKGAVYDWMLVHFLSLSDLEAMLPKLKDALDKKGCLWISWPKKASGIKTDLNDNVVRETGLATGLVDTKVCAIDETWSGLKFMWRVKDR
jgi:hypothetical protein